MISLPGLNLSSQPAETQNGPTSTATRTQELAANTEYRFEVLFSQTLTIKLLLTPNASTSGDSSDDAPQTVTVV